MNVRTITLVLSAAIILSVAAFLKLILWQSGDAFVDYSHRDGKREAIDDFSHGIFKWKVAGLVHDFDSRAAVAKKRLGVELDWFGGCIGSEDRDSYEYNYNAAAWDHLVSRFGESEVAAVLRKPLSTDAPKIKPANQTPEPTPPSRRGSS